MKQLIIGVLAGVTILISSCYKDKGNYDYKIVEKPIVSNIDSNYNVFLGDTLKVSPVVVFSNKAKLSYEWRISVASATSGTVFTGPELKIPFGYGANKYSARLAILDSTTNLKYFYDFLITGKTAFSTGTTVLSQVGTKSILSFIKPDGSIVQNVFETLNGRALPDGPLQIISLINKNVGNLMMAYLITATQENEGGVLIDPNTLKMTRTLRDNFFTPPAAVKTGFVNSASTGVIEGVINGKLYLGASQTFYGSSIYGFFGVPADGDYQAFRKCLVNPSFPFYFGYDVNRKQFLGFTNFGSPSYIGTTYQVVGSAGFDPRNVGLDMLNIEQVNATDGYAFGKGSDGIIYELKYAMGFPGTIQITPTYKRAFIQQALIKTTTLWQVTPAQIFFFTSGDKIYRYNPLNEEVLPLTTNFGGKNVSMIKLADSGNTLVAGVDGALYYLDVSVGKFGDIKKQVNGITGIPIDIAIR